MKLKFSRFNNAFKTIRLYKCPCQGCVQTDFLSGSHKTKSAVIRLLKKHQEKKKHYQSDKHIKTKSGKGR